MCNNILAVQRSLKDGEAGLWEAAPVLSRQFFCYGQTEQYQANSNNIKQTTLDLWNETNTTDHSMSPKITGVTKNDFFARLQVALDNLAGFPVKFRKRDAFLTTLFALPNEHCIDTIFAANTNESQNINQPTNKTNEPSENIPAAYKPFDPINLNEGLFWFRVERGV